MNQLAKTISDNSKIISEIAVDPATITKLLSIIPKQLLEGDIEYVEDHFKNMDNNQRKLCSWGSDGNEDVEKEGKGKEIRLKLSKIQPVLLPPLDGVVNNNKTKNDSLYEITSQGDQPIFD